MIDRVLLSDNYTLPSRTIITGDFNAHHPWWNSSRAPRNADSVITFARRLDLDLINVPDTPTYVLRNGQGTSVLDLTFITTDLHKYVDDWCVDEEALTGSDHLPVRFTIISENSRTVESPMKPRLNWSKTDWDLFNNTLLETWKDLQHSFYRHLSGALNCTELDSAATLLSTAISRASEKATPANRSCPKSKVWWNEEINSARRSMRRAHRWWKQDPNEGTKRTFKTARNEYFHCIRQAKQEKWTEFLEEAKGQDIFQVLRYTKPRRNQATPVLLDERQKQHITFEEKCILFRTTMFPPPPETENLPPPQPPRIPLAQSQRQRSGNGYLHLQPQ